MFSKEEKKNIAEAIEKLLLDIKHPEMPTENPVFNLHVEGKEDWSWADIEPNWTYEGGKAPGSNPFNEISRELHKTKIKETQWNGFKISEMADNHVINTILFMRRTFTEKTKNDLKHAYDYGEPNTDAGQDIFRTGINKLNHLLEKKERIHDELIENCQEYAALFEESKKRKLKW